MLKYDGMHFHSILGMNETLSNSTMDLPICDGQTLFNNKTCLVDETTPTQPPPVTLSPELLIVVVTVPVLTALLVLVCVMLLILCLCVCLARSRKRKHSMNIGECM